MKGNFHVRFLGERAVVTPPAYPTDHLKEVAAISAQESVLGSANALTLQALSFVVFPEPGFSQRGNIGGAANQIAVEVRHRAINRTSGTIGPEFDQVIDHELSCPNLSMGWYRNDCAS